MSIFNIFIYGLIYWNALKVKNGNNNREISANSFNIELVLRWTLAKHRKTSLQNKLYLQKEQVIKTEQNQIDSVLMSLKRVPLLLMEFWVNYEFELRINSKLEYLRRSIIYSLKLFVAFILTILYQK